VLTVQTESDVTGVLAGVTARQPDSSRFRWWEIAGGLPGLGSRFPMGLTRFSLIAGGGVVACWRIRGWRSRLAAAFG